MSVFIKYKCWNMKKMIFLKELILISQKYQRTAIFVINCEAYLCNSCHDLMQKAMNFNDVAIVSIKRSYYRIHFWYMSKSDAINLLNNSWLDNKGVL